MVGLRHHDEVEWPVDIKTKQMPPSDRGLVAAVITGAENRDDEVEIVGRPWTS